MVGPEIVPPGRIEDAMVMLAHARPAVPERINGKAALGVKNLRELGREEAFEFVDRHQHGHWPAPVSDSLRRISTIEKVIAGGAAVVPCAGWEKR